MHTTAIIIVRWRKKSETTACIRTEAGGSASPDCLVGRREGGEGEGLGERDEVRSRHAIQNVLLETGFGFKVASAFIIFTWR